jgi:hypothetical protein
MKIKEYLDYCLNKYFLQTLEENQFKLTNSDFSSNAGKYTFNNNILNFNIINDRGLIETSISSIYSDRFHNFETINLFLNPIDLNKKDRLTFGKNGNSKRLSLTDISELFENSIEKLNFKFDKCNYIETEKKLNKLETKNSDFEY